MSGDETLWQLLLDTLEELGGLIGESTIPNKVMAVIEILNQLEEEMPAKPESLKQLKEALGHLDGALTTLLIHLKYRVFDLEASQRELETTQSELERVLEDNHRLRKELKKR